MKYYRLSILLVLLLPLVCAVQLNAQDAVVGYGISLDKRNTPMSVSSVSDSTVRLSPYNDVAKALYGKLPGLAVYQGRGSSADNYATLSLRGHTPLVLVDGFERDLSTVHPEEIQSIYILKDAAALALYGVRGGNGVLMVTTKRGVEGDMKISAAYSVGFNMPFRNPKFSDAYTYASWLNQALISDGGTARYSDYELSLFQNGSMPYQYPNVDWWGETMNNMGYTHDLNLIINGGSDRFRYYADINYYHDRSMLQNNTLDNRYTIDPTDVRFSLRTNLDIKITDHTLMGVGLYGKLQELNGPRYGRNDIFNVIYNTPSAAFPIRHKNGVIGGSLVHGNKNPYALLKEYGHSREIFGTLLADLTLRQDLSGVVEGLGASAGIAFDNVGSMSEHSQKEFRYFYENPRFSEDGTLITTPTFVGKDSEVLGHNLPFNGLMVSTNAFVKVDYDNTFGEHAIKTALIYDQSSIIKNGRNNTRKNQAVTLYGGYNFAQRYLIDLALSYSGSAFLPDGNKFHLYPAISTAWILSNESFAKEVDWMDYLKLKSSFGVSGYDGNLKHELWRHQYNSWVSSYNFGENATQVGGNAEGDIPVTGLVPEKSTRFTAGVEWAFFSNRLTGEVEYFNETRSDILVSGSNTISKVLGIGVGQENAGINKFMGYDFRLRWQDFVGDFHYGVAATLGYLNSKIVKNNEAYQQYDYLYREGNSVWQNYGLEAIGIFASQQEINNSPRQTFSIVKPGDLKYKDQNGDNIIDDRDVVKMYQRSKPSFYYGFSLSAGYDKFTLLADFQGVAGKAVSLLSSPLYKPLVNNGNISDTFLDREVPWTLENAHKATMPRVSSVENANNYRPSSFWYRDGSFLKLRNLRASYQFEELFNRDTSIELFVQGTNLFSIDAIGFADPEQLGLGYPATRSVWLGFKIQL